MKSTAAGVDDTSGPERHPHLITIEGVTRQFRSRGRHVTAVNGVSLAVRRGEVLGIVGESGSGKSTLAKLLVRLDTPSHGALEMDGVDYRKLRGSRGRRFRAAVQMVFQHPAGSLNPRLRVGTSIKEPMRSPKVSRERGDLRVRELLREVGLSEDSAGRLPHEFSGGQKQRIAIARALSSSPEIVVLDEPTSALDVSVQAQVLDLLDRVRREHELTYVLISHNLAVVRAVCDRVAVMYAGRVVEVGDTDTIFTNSQHWYTRALIAAVPSTDPRRRESSAGDPAGEAKPTAKASDTVVAAPALTDGCAFAGRCPRAEARCWTEVPTLDEVQPGQHAACHFPYSTGSRRIAEGEHP